MGLVAQLEERFQAITESSNLVVTLYPLSPIIRIIFRKPLEHMTNIY